MVFTTNKKFLLRHFGKDPVLFAYHIGDLDEFYFDDCLWPARFGQRDGIAEVLLMYSGCETPTLLAFGLTDQFAELLSDYLPLAPQKFFCHFQKQYREIFTRYVRETRLGTHLKMRLDRKRLERFDATTETDITVSGLDRGHEAELRELYAPAYPDNYFVPRMLETGQYLGARIDNRLIGVAGVHVTSDEHRVAVLGNLAIHPDYRGRGLATRLTYQLSRKLTDEGKLVCLNVKKDNLPAIACYQKIGFETVLEYEEAMFRLKR